MSSTSYRQLTLNGLWKNNPALVQLLGLCPLLAVTASTVNALGLAAGIDLPLCRTNPADLPALCCAAEFLQMARRAAPHPKPHC